MKKKVKAIIKSPIVKCIGKTLISIKSKCIPLKRKMAMNFNDENNNKNPTSKSGLV